MSIDLDELERMTKKKPVCSDDIMDMLCAIPDLIAENRALRERAQMRQELVEQYEKDIARLRQRVREMDRQMVWLAKQVCDSLSPQEWINRAEQATKEDGE